MGTARTNGERRDAPPPIPRWGSTRTVKVTIAVVALAVAGAVTILALTRQSSLAPLPATSVPAGDRNAPASLKQAADNSGFHPSTESGAGQIEGKPASAANPPFTTNLLAPGTVAPALTLKSPQGKSYSLSRLRGKPVLLEFFATWCRLCNAEGPHLVRLAKALGNGSAFLSVNADGEDAGSVFAYHRYFGFPFPALLDPSDRAGSFTLPGDPGPVTNAYHVQSLPAFYVIGPNGKVAWASDGEQPDAKLRQELRQSAGS